MNQSIRDFKKTRGRPKTTGAGKQVAPRWRDEELAEIDAWRRRQEDLPTRTEAIRRLVRLALDLGKPKARGK